MIQGTGMSTINRRQLLGSPAGALAASFLVTKASVTTVEGREFSANGLSGCQLMSGAQFGVGVDNKGLWPNLTKLPDGEIAAAVYNHPSHGYGSNSDVELWISNDAGHSWRYRSHITDHPEEPNGIRMNHAVGLNAKGELIAIVSGYQEGQKLPYLPLQRCLSSDHGRSWRRDHLDLDMVPHGDVFQLSNGRLGCSMYMTTRTTPRRRRAAIVFSDDDGKTWGNQRPMADADIGETHVIRQKNGNLLAVGRTSCVDRMDGALPHGTGEILLKSTDEGETWSEPKLLSPQGQENAHLLELSDGQLLCSFTSRIPGLFGVVLRMSSDGGVTWSLPVVLISSPARDWRKTDCGYPSSIQLEDGTIVTAYYFGPKKPEWAAHALPWHQRYHMGVARWNLMHWPEFEA
jgi:photosystem II stability/assembly factor-like uncharacterized protein